MTDMILPEGWVEVRLPQVANISTGKVDANHAVKNGKYAFYTCAIEPLKSDTYSFEGELLILPGNGANVGHVKFYNGRLEAYQRTYIIYNINIIAKFLFWSLKERWKQLTIEKQYGSATNYIKIGNFNNYVFFMPPLAEQEEIAQRVDRAIGHVDELKSRLETLLTTLKTFRQSVLNAAITGKLTENWREENDFVIFQSFDNTNKIKKFREKVLTILPLNWSWLDFLSTAEIAPNLQDPCLTPDDIHIAPNHIESKTGRLLQYSTVKQDKVFSAKHRFNKGQILYSKIRPYLCKVIIANVSGLCSADMYPINAKINVVYLYYWMLSDEFTNWASTAESRSVLPKINQKDLNKIPVPPPPLEEQEEIVKQVEAYFALADQIEKQVQSALDKVNLLTQSILAKAFRGELTKEWRQKNPELISGENSAEALLKRIKAEKDALEKPSKKTKNTKVQTGFFN